MKKVLISQKIILLILFVGVTSQFLNATILFRETFEKSRSRLHDWSISKNEGYVITSSENILDRFSSQSHGDKSLIIYDPIKKQSYANASVVFKNTSSDYMIEFYFQIHQQYITSIEFFSLCILGNKINNKYTDIKLFLHQKSNFSENMYIYVEYADGLDSQSVVIKANIWNKIQIYRHRSEDISVISLYLNGDSLATYAPINPSWVTNKIRFGSNVDDVLARGELCYDDVIVSTPPIGRHPRLLFSDSQAREILRRRIKDTLNTSIGVSYHDIWNTLNTEVLPYRNEKYFVITYPSVCTLYHPFPQPQRHEPGKHVWTFASRQLEKRLEMLSFFYFVTESPLWKQRAKTILLSLCNSWHQWTDPDFPARYVHLDVGQFSVGVAFAYDLLFNSLSDYEKLTVQNSLLSLGIAPLYLNALDDRRGRDPIYWPNGYAQMNSSMGIAALVIDNDLEELDTARVRIAQMLNEKRVCDRTGGWVEGILYSTYAITYMIMYSQADYITTGGGFFNHSYLRNHAYWRLQSLLPGGRNEINFGDSPRYHVSCEPMFFLASLYNDSHIQWYLAKAATRRKKIGDFFPLAPFLWLNSSLKAIAPSDQAACKLFSDIGWVVLRTGWQKGDYLLALKSSYGREVEHGFWHCHEDQNHFIFGTNGKWLIGDPGYGVQHARWHNVITIDRDDNQDTHFSGGVEDYYTCKKYGYAKFNASSCYAKLNQYLREALFIFKPEPFVILFDRIESINQKSMHTINWRIHTTYDIKHNNKDMIAIDGSIDVRILKPSLTEISIDDTTINGNTLHSINILNRYTAGTKYLVVIVPSDDYLQSIETIQGQNLIGVNVNSTFVAFSDILGPKYDSLGVVGFQVSTKDAILSLICNLVPNSTYVITLKTDAETVITFTKQTNDVGIVSFQIPGGDHWDIIVSHIEM